MKKIFCIALTAIVAMQVGSLPAFADRSPFYRHGSNTGNVVRHAPYGHHGRIGVTIGGAWMWPGWWEPYPYYPYYPGPAVVVREPAEIQVQPAPVIPEPEYRYYCPDPPGFYPGINRCPKGWLKVVVPANPTEEEE